jgi:hypothetical protein
MTYQQDPDDPARRPMDHDRKENGWSFAALLVAIVAAILLGSVLLSPRSDTTGPTAAYQSKDVPQTRSTIPPPPPATPPK